MRDMIKKAFDQVQADEELKAKTQAFLSQKTKGYTHKKTFHYRQLIPAVACMLLLLLGGHWLYFTPTVELSIDINPSIELGINRFDRVISVTGYNEDGRKLASSLDVKYMDYTTAVDQILQEDSIVALLSKDELLSIGVIGTDEAQSYEVYSAMESCTAKKENTHCYYAHADEVDSAHEMGLSYGKYRAFLELQALDPSISSEEIQHMTMREIRDLINSLGGNDENTLPEENYASHGHHGTGTEAECGRGNGHGARN